MTCAYSLSPQEAEADDYEFKASLSYVVRAYLKSSEIGGRKRRGGEKKEEEKDIVLGKGQGEKAAGGSPSGNSGCGRRWVFSRPVQPMR